MAPTLRTATIEDLPALKILKQKLVDHERPMDKGIPREGIVEYYNVEELLEDENTGFYVVEIDGKIAGCAYGQIRENNKWAVNDKYGHIGFMYVKEEYRKQDIGKMVINAVIAWLKERNIDDIRLQVYAENTGAVEAYKKYGFKEFYMMLQYR